MKNLNLIKTVEIETETFNSMTRDIVDTKSKKKETFQSNKKNNAGFCLLHSSWSS